MSNPHTIIVAILRKWEDDADTSSTEVIIDEIAVMFSEFQKAKIEPQDILKFKDKILKTWIDLTWSDAKKTNPGWKNEEWWKKRKGRIVKAFGKEYENYKDSINEAAAKKKEEENTFENVEDMIAWAEKRKRAIP